jgi:hypothetical protein
MRRVSLRRTEAARPFLVRQVDPRLVVGGRRWAVRQGERWRFAQTLCVQVTVASVDDRAGGECLAGVGVVHCLKRGEIVITA